MNKFVALEDLLRTAGLNPELTQYQFKLNAQEIDKRLKFQLLLPQVNLKYNQIGYNFQKRLKQLGLRIIIVSVFLFPCRCACRRRAANTGRQS